MAPLLYFLFFLSGAAGLMYESVWTRYLSLFVGSQAYAQVLVLVIFLGGMSLGAMLVARRAERLTNPLRSYALMEGLIGLIALVFHPIFVTSTDWAYAYAFPALTDGPWLAMVKWGLAALLILPQSILLGTTFPLMSAAVLRGAPAKPGRVLGWLYFTNSIGAALGVLIAGFVVVELFGLPGVVRIAGALNLIVAAAAFLMAQRRGTVVPYVAPVATSESGIAPRRLERLLLGAAFLTAVASFCYEIDWVRMLSLVLGSATRSFELMLSAFILGLSLGAFWIRRRGDRFADPILALSWIQIAMGLLAVATLPLYIMSFHGMQLLLAALARNGPGYALFTLSRYAICLVVMLPATFCAGMTLPLITKVLLRHGRGEAAIGRVYAVNTLGSIIGVALAALYLLPALGLEWLLISGATVDIAVGVLLLGQTRRRAWRWAVTSAATAMLVVVAWGTRFDRGELTSGVYRYGRLGHASQHSLGYYADGRTATVSVSQDPEGGRVIATNGKVDAAVSGASRKSCDTMTPRRTLSSGEALQLLTGVIPMGYVPSGGSAAIIGFGAGVSTHTLLASTMWRDVTTIEIEPRMVDGARLFLPANRRAFEDPRSHIVIDDAKAYFAATGKRFDLIISEPSNPWVKGVSGLFTVEFYRRLRTQLAPGGVFVQWLAGQELDDPTVFSILSALNQTFPDWRIHELGGNSLLLVAARDGSLPTPDWNRVAATPEFQQDFCGLPRVTGDVLSATFMAGRALLAPAVERLVNANSDYYPVLDLRSERYRFEEREARGTLALADDWFNLGRELVDARQMPVAMQGIPFAEQRRVLEGVLRTWQSAPEIPDTLLSPLVAQARFDWDRWHTMLARDHAPADWRAWLYSFLLVTRVRHAGTAGWIDSTLFHGAEAFAERHHAPQVVHAVLAFRRGVQSWDARATLAAATSLAGTALVSQGWIDADELRDGAVVAALRLGNGEEAQSWWDELAGRSTRSATDARSLILSARIAAALDTSAQR